MATRKSSSPAKRRRRSRSNLRQMPQPPPRPPDHDPEARRVYDQEMARYQENMRAFMRRRGTGTP